ncbi:hypothetical protein GCM10020254_53270 [Streptomyces goshikiensis]
MGAHIDRDELRVVRVDLAGRVTADWREPLDFGAGPGVVLDAVADAVVRAFAHPESGAGPSPVLGGGHRRAGPARLADRGAGAGDGVPGVGGVPVAGGAGGAVGGVAVVLDKDTNAGVGGADGGGDFGASVYLHVGTGLGAGLRLNGEVYRGGAVGGRGVRAPGADAGRAGVPVRGAGVRGGAVPGRGGAGDLAEAARVLGEAAANLVALLDVDRVVLGGRVVEAAAGVFVEGVAGGGAGGAGGRRDRCPGRAGGGRRGGGAGPGPVLRPPGLTRGGAGPRVFRPGWSAGCGARRCRGAGPRALAPQASAGLDWVGVRGRARRRCRGPAPGPPRLKRRRGWIWRASVPGFGPGALAPPPPARRGWRRWEG